MIDHKSTATEIVCYRQAGNTAYRSYLLRRQTDDPFMESVWPTAPFPISRGAGAPIRSIVRLEVLPSPRTPYRLLKDSAPGGLDSIEIVNKRPQ
jgi:hypothetical protein